MNDLDLAQSISDDVGAKFLLAKEVAEEYPGYCLVTLRGMCKLVCQRIIEALNLAIPNPKTAELDTLIHEVSIRTKPSSRCKDALHQLRRLGNKGAHPEDGGFNNEQLLDFARSALSHAVTALQFAHTQIFPSAELNAPISISPVDSGMKALCYRATIREEADAQYWLGKHFLAKAAALEETPEENARHHSWLFVHEIAEEKKKANYWFRLAAHQEHAAALYEHGRLLIDRIEGEQYVAMGVNNIFRSANEGNAEANAYVGHVFYHGLHDQPQDFVEARKHFEIAASEDHPSALTMLGVMYLRGEGGPANPQAAFDYTRKSAEAGYPTGQFNLSVYYWNGEIVEKNTAEALDWLSKAADQNLPDALFALAELIQDELVPGKSLADAEGVLARCMNAENAESSLRSKAAFQYARLLASHNDQLPKLTSSADILQRCYEGEDGEGELAQACVELAKLVLGHIKKLIAMRQGTAEEIVAAEWIANFFFDGSGKPIRKRSVGLDKLGQTMRELSEAKNHLSPGLYERRVLEKAAPILTAQSKGKNVPRLVCSSRSKVGRNDPCPCNSGKKFKHCCDNR